MVDAGLTGPLTNDVDVEVDPSRPLHRLQANDLNRVRVCQSDRRSASWKAKRTSDLWAKWSILRP